MISTVPNCPRCHAPIPVYAPEGLCPRCLLVGPDGAGDRTEANPAAGAIAPIAPGARLRYVGDYELLGEVARGGMGVVYRARQVSLDRVVGIKMLLAGALAGPEAVERFLREAEAAASLHHPNIVAIHEVGRAGDQHYFSMDYVDGPSLAAVIAAGPLPAPRAAQLVATIARAVDHAHQRGILHRDLKPHNVLMAGDEPRVADFGLARSIDGAGRLTETGAVLGSPCYMPPEQALGRADRVGPPSDVYGLGAILYEALTGRPPFAGATSAATVQQVLDSPPVAPSRLDPRIPRDLETVCLRCLEKEPARRYPSARALADDLDRFGRGEPVEARRPGAVRRIWGALARRPWMLCAIAAVLLLVAAGAIYALWVENEHLRWTHAHPGETPDTVRLLRRAEDAGTAATLMFGMLALASCDLRARSRRGGWAALNRTFLVDPGLPERPLAPAFLAAYGAFGGVGVGLALGLAGRMIEAWVWDGALSLKLVLGSLYPCLWFSLALVVQAARHHYRAQRGFHVEPSAAGLAPPASAEAAGAPSPSWTRVGVAVLAVGAVVATTAWAVPAIRGAVPYFAASCAYGLALAVASRLRSKHAGAVVIVAAMLAPLVLIVSRDGPLGDWDMVALFAGAMVGVGVASRVMLPRAARPTR